MLLLGVQELEQKETLLMSLLELLLELLASWLRLSWLPAF